MHNMRKQNFIALTTSQLPYVLIMHNLKKQILHCFNFITITARINYT